MPEPDDGTSRAAFQIAYDGSATAAHSMDVQLLGPALLSVGDLCREANAVIYGPDAPDVNVRVRANFEEGCFDISFDFVQALKDVGTLVRTAEVADAKTLLEWIGLVGGPPTALGTSLWGFLKWKRGRKIRSAEKNENASSPAYTISVEGDGNTIEISAPVYNLITSPRVRAAQRGVAAPLKHDGIDSVEVRQNGEPVTKLTREEFQDGAFDILEGEVAGEERLEPQEIDCVLVIRAPVFVEGLKWHFWLGQQRISASISDESFSRRVFAGGERFGVGDRLHVRLKLTQVLTPQGVYRNEYDIPLVTKIEPGPRQLTFLDELGEVE